VVVARDSGLWCRLTIQKAVLYRRAALAGSGMVGGWPEVVVVDKVPTEEGNWWQVVGPEVEGAIGWVGERLSAGGSLSLVTAGPLRGQRC
jgi:hypothetical protein